ncbi:TTF2 factor, partial [Atractosteus spatula]|nr:TTF2 factor [Atractosteus spatula]
MASRRRPVEDTVTHPAMEEVICDRHGRPCLLKTGVRDGPNKGKSFYLCSSQGGAACDFTKPAHIPPSHCLHHEDSWVELQALVKHEGRPGYRLLFRCVTGKAEGKKWCGNIPWQQTKQEGKSPPFNGESQPSKNPVERNPFRVTSKPAKSSDWKALHEGGDERAGLGGAEGGGNQAGAAPPAPESWREKRLPAGVKLKQRSPADGQAAQEGLSKQDDSRRGPREERLQPEGSREESGISSGGSERDVQEQPEEDVGSASGAKVATCRGSPKPSRAESRKAQARPPSDPNPTPGPIEKRHPSMEQTAEQAERTVDEDVLIVSVQPGNKKTCPAALVQKTLTSFHGFLPSSQSQPPGPRALHSTLSAQLRQKKMPGEEEKSAVCRRPASRTQSAGPGAPFCCLPPRPAGERTGTVNPQYNRLYGSTIADAIDHLYKSLESCPAAEAEAEDPKELKVTLSTVNISTLPDKGQRLISQVKELEDALESLSLSVPSDEDSNKRDARGGGEERCVSAPSQQDPVSRPGGTVLLPAPAPSRGADWHRSGVNPQYNRLYGSTIADAIDHLYKSLESCPAAEAEAEDPKELKVHLLPHQKQALAWLLWRETQKPSGGILADDMGLGKTLTMIALILAQRKKEKKDKKPEGWISKNDPSPVVSQGTLIICPASLIHHWKMEVEKHVKGSALSVCLYHGPNRQRSARILAEHDVVVTTYSLVSKEIPSEKDGAAEEPPARPRPPLLAVTWSRIVLDEAHNVKNPRVQTSLAVCQLRAGSRWAVTGTPVQNNLLDLYSLLKFLRCSPFDDYKLWKAHVDNGSKRGGERLNILTKALLLRRTKDQFDSTGKPLVSLPERCCHTHRLKLSEDEQSVYNVLFAKSVSTLQSYLKRYERQETKEVENKNNPFDKVAQEFVVCQRDVLAGAPQQSRAHATSTVHILSLLLRLRQCCCHLSLLRKTLDRAELQDEGIVLSLEEQLNALSLSELSGPDPKSTVSLNGKNFRSDLFDETKESTKISAVLAELKEIGRKSEAQKSVIVSQWTSMLRVVAVHLDRLGLRYATIDGSVSPRQRMELVEEFNTNPRGPQVMLVSLCAGGVGINLTGGNHLFLIDMHWNPALEDQACDRIYRVGQLRNVTIHRFVCDGTVEDKISSLQEKKKDLARKVLSGSGDSFTKLTLMIVLIVIIAGLIIFILALAFSRAQPSTVESPNPYPVGNINDAVVLDCKFNPLNTNGRGATQIAITWEKEGLTGVVYKYANAVGQLQTQNPDFINRAQLFPDVISNGNASLLLRSVQVKDEGLYKCSVSASNGQGEVNIHLRVAAYSSPKFTTSNQTLKAVAQRWYPRPSVTWTNSEGADLKASTSFVSNPAGIVEVTSALTNVSVSDVLTCTIGNSLVKSVSQATATDSGVIDSTYFVFSGADQRPLDPKSAVSYVLLWMYWTVC